MFQDEFYGWDEKRYVRHLLDHYSPPEEEILQVTQEAHRLIEQIRACSEQGSWVTKLLRQYDLNTPQGLSLMSLAEAFLRVPDRNVAQKLLQDKMAQGEWDKVQGDGSLFVKGSRFSFSLLNKFLQKNIKLGTDFVVQFFVERALKLIARHFILGATIEEAFKKSTAKQARGDCYSFDMLGEAAVTPKDADRYFAAYNHAITVMGAHKQSDSTALRDRPSLSVKLSALYPRYHFAKESLIIPDLAAKVIQLARRCREHNLRLTLDAEEADRLSMSLKIFEAVFRDPSLKGWSGLGLAVQAYQRRALSVIEGLAKLAQEQGRQINVRLVKGAYWDSEIKEEQVQGFADYSVFTRKAYTDVSYLACAQKLLDLRQDLYPMFATHNAQTVAAILQRAQQDKNGSENSKTFEFQRLQGMGEKLYDVLRENSETRQVPCRVYAPVGAYKDLLPYLVRRLLENGANNAFVNLMMDPQVPIAVLAENPFEKASQLLKDDGPLNSGPLIPLPRDLFGKGRLNAAGLDLSDQQQLNPVFDSLEAYQRVTGGTLVGGEPPHMDAPVPCFNPANHEEIIGYRLEGGAEHVSRAFNLAYKAFPQWSQTSVMQRAQILEAVADLFESQMNELIALVVKEAGKTLSDAVGEVREAVDFCRYYAQEARDKLEGAQVLPGPAGEDNSLSLAGRGVFLCVSPWNFPLAIFVGQVAAALVTGNTVVAKPASATPLIAYRAVKLFHRAGIPEDVLHLVSGEVNEIGDVLVNHPYLAGLAVTGSVETAHRLNRTLAARPGPILPLIAETGGLNAMIVDSSALPEQVVEDVLVSAFQSAGQRCSALRVLLLQEEISEVCLKLLRGAMTTLQIGDPSVLSTDVGPVIHNQAKEALEAYSAGLKEKGRLLFEAPLPEACRRGSFVAPKVFEIHALDELESEQFGPLLHVMRYKAEELDQILHDLKALGYGLTLGIQSRVDSTISHICQRASIGNIYVNRNMIGAVVGCQPFGGQGLSGTGPKAGGPHYLQRFLTEKSLCVNTMAQGGNPSLFIRD